MYIKIEIYMLRKAANLIQDKCNQIHEIMSDASGYLTTQELDML